MKKKYSFVMLLMLIAAITLANAQAKKVSYTFYDLTSARLNATYTDSESNSIKFSTNEPSPLLLGGSLVYTRELFNPLECWGGTTPNAQYSWARFTAAIDLLNLANTPYILIDLVSPTNSVIGFEIGAKGSALGSSLVTVAFSGTTNDKRDNYSGGIGLSVGANLCLSSASISSSYVSIPKGTRYIRVSADPLIGGLNINLSALLNPLQIYSFRFYVEDYLKINSSNPTNNSENILPATPIKITYDRTIKINNAAGITLNDQPVSSSDLSINGNILTINHPPFDSSSSISLDISTDAIKGTDDAVLESSVSTTFQISPPLITVPANIQFTTKNNTPITSPLQLVGNSLLESLDLTNAIFSISGDNSAMFTLETVNIATFIANLQAGLANLNITYHPTDGRITHNAALLVTVTTNTGIPISVSLPLVGQVSSVVSIDPTEFSKIIASETYYNLSGVKVTKTDKSKLYIKQTTYTDGTIKVEKVYIDK